MHVMSGVGTINSSMRFNHGSVVLKCEFGGFFPYFIAFFFFLLFLFEAQVDTDNWLDLILLYCFLSAPGFEYL